VWISKFWVDLGGMDSTSLTTGGFDSAHYKLNQDIRDVLYFYKLQIFYLFRNRNPIGFPGV